MKIHRLLLALGIGASVAATTRGATLTWTNTAGGAWTTAANWSPNQVPAAADNASITNSGTYTVTLDANTTVASLTLGGTSGTQTFSASSRTLTLNGASAIHGNGVLALANSTVAGTGTLANLGRLNVDNSTINAALVNQGLLVFRGVNNNLGGSFGNQAGATLRVLGANNFGQAILNVANGFTNSGVIELTSVVEVQNATLNVNSGSLVNAAGGQINVLAGTGGPRTLGVQLDNRGTVTINQALTLDQGSADHLNNGTITLSGGDFTVSQSFITPSFTTTGTIEIGSGRIFTVSAVGGGTGTFNYNAGTLAGAGTLNLNFTVANFTPNFSTATTTLRLANTTLNGPGTLTNAVGSTLNVDNSTINAALVNQGLLVFRGVNNNLGGSFGNQAGATLRVLGANNFGQAILNVANGFTNSGVIELTSVVEVQNATLNVNSGSLVNAAGGQINVLAGTGGPRTLGVQLDNRGTVTINQALTLDQGSADHLNNGTITLSGGDFTVSQSFITPSFTTTGTIDIPSGRTFTVSGGTFVNVTPGIIQGFGTLDIRFTSFTNAGNVNPGASPGILKVGGDFPQTATGHLNIEIGGRTAGADYDQLNMTGHATLGGTLEVRLINGFRPSGGDRFEILRYNSQAAFFDHIIGLNLGGGFFFQPIFSATNVVLTTIDTRPRIIFQSAALRSDGQIEFNLTGTAGQDFVIEANTNLASAVWVPVLTYTNAGAVFRFIVADATNFPVRFFRTRQ